MGAEGNLRVLQLWCLDFLVLEGLIQLICWEVVHLCLV